MKKRLISLVLIAGLILSGLAMTVSADKYTVSADSTVVKAGEEVMVTISLSKPVAKSKGVTMIQGELSYEKDALSYKSAVVGKNYPDCTCVESNREQIFKFNWFSDTSTAVGLEAGAVVKVIFTAKKDISTDNIDAKMDLDLILQNANGEDVDSDVTVYICKEHKWDSGKVVKEATLTNAGERLYTCGCGETKTEAIAKIAAVELSKTSFTYNKKVQTPSVVVKDSAGNVLAKDVDYTVAYAAGRKNVGIYKATVTFTGKYSGTKELTFSIDPKTTKLATLKAGKKKLTAKWKKLTVQTNGYEVQYGLKKNFKGAKTKTVKKNKTISLTISKLKSNKTYYVRVRTYKNVKVNGKITKVYSSWSNVKRIKVK